MSVEIGDRIRCNVRPPSGKAYVIEGKMVRSRPATLVDRNGQEKRAQQFLVHQDNGLNRWTPAMVPAPDSPEGPE